MASVNLNLNVPDNLWAQFLEIADKNNMSILDLLKEFIKLGLVAAVIQDDPDSALFVKEGDAMRELILFSGNIQEVLKDG